MNWVLIIAASFFGAVLSALGMGGGGILLIYLTACAGVEQHAAQGINLVFFIPVAIVALTLHIRNKLVKWRIAVPCILLGLPGVWLGAWLASCLSSQALQKVFGVFLLVIGIRELFPKEAQKK